MAYLDFSKAFDVMSHYVFLNKLLLVGVDPTVNVSFKIIIY